MSVQDLILKSGGAGNLPAQMAMVAQLMQQQAFDIHRIAEALTVTTPSQPDAYGHWARFDGTTWQTSEQGIVVGLLVTSDTTDFYELLVGNGGANFAFGLTSMVPHLFELEGPRRIPITRGLTMKIQQQTANGTAVIKASICYLSGDDWGQKVK